VVRKISLLIPVLFLLVLASSVFANSYYVAGGLLSEKSEAFVDVLNPSDAKADFKVTAFFPKNDSITFKDSVMPHSVRKVILANYLPKGIKDSDFGLKIESASSIYVEHSMYDKDHSCGFGDVAVEKPAFAWYFAEGFTSKDLNTWIFLLNPSDDSAAVEVTLYYEGGQKKVFNVDLPAQRSKRIDTHDESLPDKKFGIVVTSATPIVAETLNYDEEKSGCSGGMGANALADKWYFAEGYASLSASEFLSIVNPSGTIAHTTLNVYYDDGTTDVFIENVGAQSKKTIEHGQCRGDDLW
jgi:hypothetical protein